MVDRGAQETRRPPQIVIQTRIAGIARNLCRNVRRNKAYKVVSAEVCGRVFAQKDRSIFEPFREFGKIPPVPCKEADPEEIEKGRLSMIFHPF